MKEIEVSCYNLNRFFDDIRSQDLDELNFIFKTNIKENFLRICLENKDTYFLADDLSFPLAIGGIKIIPVKKILVGQVWFLCTNHMFNHKLAVLKYVKNKIIEFKKECDILFNFIYKSNFDFLKWLKRVGFKDLEFNKDFKLFYCKKGGIDFDLRRFAC